MNTSMTEKGSMLTLFEECFGSMLDHEVIKAILQNVDWNYAQALEACSSMVEPANIPEHVLTKIVSLLQESEGHVLSENSGENESTDLLRSSLVSENAAVRNGSGVMEQEKDEGVNHILRDEVSKFASVEHNFLKQTNVLNDTSSTPSQIKSTNFSQISAKKHEQRIYDKFIIDASYLSKGSSVPPENTTTSILKHGLPELEKATCKIQFIKTLLDKNNVLILMRGLPGSGKSTLARRLVEHRGVVLSADDYFMSSNGRYNFDPTMLGDAHSWSRKQAQSNISQRSNPIIIDNTNLQAWEMKPYVHMALKNGYLVEFLEPDTPWRYNPSELARRNSHGVPKNKIEEMLARFVTNISLRNFNFPCDPGEIIAPIPKMSNHVANSYSGVSTTINGHLNVNYGLCDIINDLNSKEGPVQKSSVANKVDSPPISSLTDCINHLKNNIDSEFLDNRERSPDGPIDDEKFNDIVQSLDTEVKKQIKQTPSIKTEKGDQSTLDEDRKMYLFCDDLEDKLGNSISSLIRPQLSRGLKSCSSNGPSDLPADVAVELAVNCNVKIVKAPALDTVTEELTKDLSNSRTVLEQDSDVSEGSGEDTSNDASSIELAGDESDEPNSVTKVESWQCLEPENAYMDWEETGGVVEESKGIDEPLDIRSRKRKNESLDNSVVIVEENPSSFMPMAQAAATEGDSWVADFKTDSWDVADDDLDAKISKLQKTGAVPKHIREKLRPPKKNNIEVPYISMHEESKSIGTNDGSPLNLRVTATAKLLDNLSVGKVTIATQTELDKTLKDNTLKVLHGDGQNYKLGAMAEISSSGPITKDIFMLDKGTMTNIEKSQETEGKVEDLLCFFPNIPTPDLQDILLRCKGDVDWAMNILLDSGYQIEESSNESIDVDLRNQSVSPVCSDSSSVSSTSASSGSKSKKKSRRQHKRHHAKELLSDEVSLLSDENMSSFSPTTEIKQVSPLKDSSESSSQCDKLPQQVSLELDPLFAYQLVNIFGPVAHLDLNHSFENNERRVNLPLSLCQEIHRHWNASLQNISVGDEQFMQEMIDKDAAFAHQLQLQEEREKLSNKPFFGSFDCDQPPTNLREIMNLEKALEATKPEHKSNMAFRLSLTRLLKEFGHVDKSAVKTILEQCKGNYNEATSQLLLTFGLKDGGNNKDEALNAARRETDIVHQREEQLKANIDYKTNRDSLPDSNEHERFQLEYDMYYNLRKDLLDKARCATGPHQHEVAAHYAREARKYSDKMYETKVLMSQSALEQQNRHHDVNTLDLHLLTVSAAVSACENFLDERRRTLAADAATGGRTHGGRMTLTLITGWGRHSYQQKSIIKPAVKKFMQRKNYRVSEVSGNPGVLKVNLTL